ncbi:hypothetical protein QVD17_12934 [Tagetes erecta]|uniref:Uncharacterized protein n=1 Tax=Tagetes erecta TaxID=13708 RepID=A0AAD8P358_TARER|nr:hypothetical protein QVD17_12934 [Tagetes erecta]
MASLLLTHHLPSSASWKFAVGRKKTAIRCTNNNCQPNSFFLNASHDPILKKAFKEPVAFMGGMFAGVLRLDLKEDPLKEWVARTVEASGIVTDEEEVDLESNVTQPQQIEIE